MQQLNAVELLSLLENRILDIRESNACNAIKYSRYNDVVSCVKVLFMIGLVSTPDYAFLMNRITELSPIL